jgi:RimJ/RimL family protein N-acetyltransferase
MSIEITMADRGMIRAVLNNLRSEDAQEMAACDTDLARLPDVLMRHKVFAFCAYNFELGPVAIWGTILRRPGVGAGFAFGTEHWGKALLPMLHQIHQFVLPFLVQAGIHRVEAIAMARREDVGRFMELIGAEPEGLLRGYGTEREDFISYRWLADEYDDKRVAQEQSQFLTH